MCNDGYKFKLSLLNDDFKFWVLAFFLEKYSSCIVDYHNGIPYDPCMHNCPYCDKSIFEFVKPISRSGITMFLATNMIVNKEAELTPTKLVHKLINYPQVGRVIYGCQSATKIEQAQDAHITIMQLICAQMLHLKIKEDKKR